MLIAVATRAGVVDRVWIVFVMSIRITGVDATEVREQRDEMTVALIDAVANLVRALHLSPRENFSVVVLKFDARQDGKILRDGGERGGERAEDSAPVRGAEQILAGTFRVRHEPEDVARAVTNSCD